MGLDITAFAKVELVLAVDIKSVDWDKTDESEGQEYLWEGPAFDRMAPLVPGFYKVSEDQEGFRAGSYSGYGQWRRQIATMVGLSRDEGSWNTPGPFSELVYFADNEGTIGPTACKKLAQDFSEWRERALEFSRTTGDAEWFMRKYNDWHGAFMLAAECGAVKFH